MNVLYDKGRDAFLEGSIDWSSATIKALLVSSAYVPNLATDQFLSIISSGIVSPGVALTGKSSSAGTAAANPVTWGTVGGSALVVAVVLYKDTGVSSTSPLIAYINVATGLILTPNGGNVVWNFAGGDIFTL